MTRQTIATGIVALMVAGGDVNAAARVQNSPAPRLSGSWALNTYLSDSPQQIANEIRYDIGDPGQSIELFGSESDAGRGTDRGGRGRRNERTGPAASNKPIKPEDRKILDELTQAIQFAPTKLTIAETETQVSITTPMRGTQTLGTNGKTAQCPLDEGVVDCSSTWEGPHLLVTYQVGHAGRLRYTFALVPGSRQLVVRVSFERMEGVPAPFEIKLVYDAAPPASPPPPR
jgi:hypothetical protein